MTVLQPGQTLGPYQIIEQVGEGGMATIYRAYHPAMDRDVAIKIVPHQFAQEQEFINRFQRWVSYCMRWSRTRYRTGRRRHWR